MKKKLRGLLRIIFGRTTYVLLAILLQIAILFIPLRLMEEYVVYLYAAFVLLGAVAVIYILNEQTDSSFKLAWVIPVLVFPVFGVALYIFVHIQIIPKLMAGQLKTDRRPDPPLSGAGRGGGPAGDGGERGRKGADPLYEPLGRGIPIYRNTSAEFFPLGRGQIRGSKKAELKKARRFIFMEYFIVERGIMWNAILEILEEKVKEGVEVRVTVRRHLLYGAASLITILRSWRRKGSPLQDVFPGQARSYPPTRTTGTTGKSW